MDLPERGEQANAEGSALFLSAALYWQLCMAAFASDWTDGEGGLHWQPILELSVMNTVELRGDHPVLLDSFYLHWD